MFNKNYQSEIKECEDLITQINHRNDYFWKSISISFIIMMIVILGYIRFNQVIFRNQCDKVNGTVINGKCFEIKEINLK